LLSILGKLTRCQAANAAVEYAVCLALIVGTVLVAGFLIGGPLQTAFSTAAARMQSGANGPVIANNEHIASSTSAPPEVQAASSHALNLWLALAFAAAVPSIAALWLIRRRAARPAAAEAPEPMPVPKELQAKFVAKRQSILQFLSADTQQLVNG